MIKHTSNTEKFLYSFNIFLILMVKRAILIHLEKIDYDDLHRLMSLTLKSEDDITVFRVATGDTKQSFYRQVVREGIDSLYQKFRKIKEKHNNESQDSHRG